MKYGKTDANQAEIVDALRACGASVVILSDVGNSCPDILAGRNGHNYLLEIKTDSGKLSAGQREFHDTWRGHIAVVRNVDEALRAIGAI